MPNQNLVEACARACHEVNRAWCILHGDNSQWPWSEAPQWQREGALQGVEKAMNGATPEQLHESWCAQKIADGWQYGPTKDAVIKTHPCLVDYAILPHEQRAKDFLFAATVKMFIVASAIVG